ncbi:MAG: PEGA domain-containing protein [Planctomycetota bacterium]
MRRRAVRAAMWAWVGALAVAGVGCVERTITVTSEPAGALVHLNDEPIGRTPVRVPFTFYGVYDVRLDLAGYEPLWTQQKAQAPWWENPGPDLVGELIPGNEVGIAWHYELTPQTPVDDVDPDALIERAAAMGATVRGELENGGEGSEPGGDE